jgi:tetratricopeptide (TPR) repeat protein
VRRRVTRYFDRVSSCIQAHGGTVEKFAGDAVMAAFGIPRAHEDDAERALKAALSILDAVKDLELEARIGVEAGEVVAEDGDSTFATGEAVNRAARLQAVAEPNEILVGPVAQRLVRGAIQLDPAGERELRGLAGTLAVWRAVCVNEDGGLRLPSAAVPLVGRDWELDLLDNTYRRSMRDRRAHLVTVYGEPGVGKSRLAREFVGALERATVLSGRCLPYGEGITYWPLAEMVKAAAGISDDDPAEKAAEKLRICCEDEAVADLLGLATGVLEAVEGERSAQEIAWGAREWATQLAGEAPLVLVFEDIHWAEEPLLELIEHLAEWVRDAPLLLVCLARPELLEVKPEWGGGRVRATSVELEPLARDDSEALLDALLADRPLPAALRVALLEKTEGNPLYVEETVRMLAEDGDTRIGIPDTLQALIAARIDRLDAVDKELLQRAAVIGRVFWRGALERLTSEGEAVDELLDHLLLREFILEEPRSTISGDKAFRFKHVLIREVAYAGLPKSERADLHAAFAAWLAERTGEELLEIRAYHLDQAALLLAELDGDVPSDLRREAAAALTEGGKRALSREANRSARKLLLRAAELEPTLERRHKAAVAAWRLDDLPAVAAEMEEVFRLAEEAGERRIKGRALTALAQVTLLRDADVPRGRGLAERGLAALPNDDHAGRFDAYSLLGQMAWWEGDVTENERYVGEALAHARASGRKDLESEATQKLAGLYLAVLDLERAQESVDRACELAEESGSITTKAFALASRGGLLSLQGDLDGAEANIDEARGLFEEAGAAWPMARSQMGLAWIAWERGDVARAEKRFRESIRVLKPLEDRGALCESQRGLSELLLALGRVEEAERVALESRKTVGPYDQSSRATTRMALGLVRAAQARDEEGERLLREAHELIQPTDFEGVKLEVTGALVAFLESRGRDDEAAELEPALAAHGSIPWAEWRRGVARAAADLGATSGPARSRTAPAPVG